ncbi:MAG: hypothetical protein AAF937_01675 [Planctomycetota bacterium]
MTQPHPSQAPPSPPPAAPAAAFVPAQPAPDRSDPVQTQGVRELFWQNVIREMLTALSTAAMRRDAQVQAAKRKVMTTSIETADGTISEAVIAPEPPEDNLFDGRLALITTQGTRIPIAGVMPMFACGINTSDHARRLSVAVECTVFQVRTPTGEVYTLPLHEVRGFHALTPELVDTLKAQAAPVMPTTDEPFGFAAFTSLARDAEANAGDSPSDRPGASGKA